MSLTNTFAIRLLGFFFIIFGLMVAFPLMVWDMTSEVFYKPIAMVLTFLAVFVPIGVLAWWNMEEDPENEEVPIRMGDGLVSGSIKTGLVIGIAATLWLVLF